MSNNRTVPSNRTVPNNRAVPDYALPDRVEASSPAQLRAIAHPLRSTLLDLVLERAATVGELAAAVGRPNSTVAHHVGVLTDAGLLRVVRTRRVRAIEERFYGRTGRAVDITPTGASPSGSPPRIRLLADAAAEAGQAGEVLCTLRHVRLDAAQAEAFWRRVLELADEFTRLPRTGDVVHALAAAVYPTGRPVLPDPTEEDDHCEHRDRVPPRPRPHRRRGDLR